jgi:transcriptional regulator of acetoin/glycerol metabolism
MIESALERTGGNIKEAAASLGIDRSTLYDKIKKYEISRP